MAIRSILRWLVGASLAVISFWNIWAFDRRAADLPGRNSKSEVFAQNGRYEPIREILLAGHYPIGNIAFITNRDLKLEQNTLEDNTRWLQAQFALIPWILVRGSRSVSGYPAKTEVPPPFVIANFSDGPPLEFPAGLVQMHQSDDGLILFKRKASQ